MNINELDMLLDLIAETENRQNAAVLFQVRQILQKCHAARFITDDGEVRQVLGTLPVTKDGMVVGCEAVVFGPGGEECLTHVRDCALALDVEVFDGQRTRKAWAWNECTGKRR